MRRNVRVQMEGMDFLTDMEEAWSDIVKSADGGDIITRDNVELANECLHKMTGVSKKFREHLQHEFNMQVLGETSNIRWGAVTQAELKRQNEGLTTTFTLTPEEVRKFEQDKLTFDRQLRLAGGASRGRGAGGGRGGAGDIAAFSDNIWMEEKAPGGSGYGRGRGGDRAGRGGRRGAPRGGGAQKVRPGLKCFKCEGPHYQRECTK